MNMQFYCKHIELSDNQKDLIREKVKHLAAFDKHIEDSSSITHITVEDMKVSDKSHHIKMHIDMKVPHGKFIGETTESSIENALDDVIKKLKHQIGKYKEKHIHLHDKKPLPIEEKDEFSAM
jgi:ribosomal subunit interface protein